MKFILFILAISLVLISCGEGSEAWRAKQVSSDVTDIVHPAKGHMAGDTVQFGSLGHKWVLINKIRDDL